MNGNDIPDLERITFFAGQRLLARDLGDMQRVDRELRWLHNRSLHTWGIGLGFGVAGERGDSAVTIAPGYGVDCLGREIILTEPRVKPIPAVAGDSAGKPVEFFRRRYLGRYNPLMMVATVDSRPVGFYCGFELKPNTFFSWLYGVLPDFRRLGIASQLMDAAEAWVAQHEYSSIRFECQNGHRPMLHLAIERSYDVVTKYANGTTIASPIEAEPASTTSGAN